MTEFEQIYREYFHDVKLYLQVLCGDGELAGELTAQTFLKAMEQLPKFRRQCHIRTWLCAIGKNCYLTHLRREKRQTDVDLEQIEDPSVTVEERVLDQDQAMAIHRVLHSLPEPYKEVFSLRVFGQLSYLAIGQLFGKSQNWACVTYHRAKEKIRNALEESQ